MNAITKKPDANVISKAFQQNITVIPELKEFMDLLSDDERKGLEADLIAHGGARDPIILWKEKQAIVDGHNRYEICKAHGLKFTTTEISFPDIDAVKQWILKNQLNRRNLSPIRITYFRGMLYNEMKQDPKQARVEAGGVKTSEKLAKQFGVDEKTIRRDGNVAAGIDAVGAAARVNSVREKLEQIKAKNFNKAELEEIGKAPEEVRVEAVKELEKIKAEETKEKTEVKKQVAAVKEKIKPRVEAAKQVAKEKPFSVAFIKPAFDSSSFNVTTEVKPPLGENAVCYMAVPDEELSKAFGLINRWGFHYEGTIVIQMQDADSYESAFADVKHVFMLVATKGIMSITGKAASSVMPKAASADEAMIKVIEGYHPKERRLDMRPKHTAKGWEKLG